MYIENFMNDKYISLSRYITYLNKDYSVIVYFKYEKQKNILFLRNQCKSNILTLNYLLLKLQIKDKIAIYIYIMKNKIKMIFLSFLKSLNKYRLSFKIKAFLKRYLLKKAHFKLKCIKNYLIKRKGIRSRHFINSNVNLYKSFKKNRLLKLIAKKLLKKQVLSNALIFDGLLALNLHPLFLKRFRFRFLKSLKSIKSSFNFNNYHMYFIYKIIPKIVNFSYLFMSLSKIKNLNIFYYLYHNYIVKKFSKLNNYDTNYFIKFRRYIVNLRNINYINVSFKLVNKGFKKKSKRKLRIYLKRSKKFNFFNFFNIAFFKLLIFLFLYWLNNLISLFNIKIKGNILAGWFKPIRFSFKTYIWRKKQIKYYLNYNVINNFIFFNYKNRLVNSSIL